jgi:hypothetical protein
MTPDKPDLERLIERLRDYAVNPAPYGFAIDDANEVAAQIALLTDLLEQAEDAYDHMARAYESLITEHVTAEQEAEGLRKDAERWQAGKRLGFPEFCPHWDGAPNGNGWYHPRLGDACFDSPEDAIDAALASRKGEA